MRQVVASALVAAALSAVPVAANAQPAREQASWAGLQVPFISVGDGREDVAVRFRGTEVSYAEFPDGIDSMAATADAAVVALTDWSDGEEFNGPLFLVGADGTTATIERHALGIPLADPNGHHVFWTAKRPGGARLMAYDTSARTKIRGPMLGSRDGRVFAVDGDEAFVAVALNDDPGAGSWSPGDSALTPMVLHSSDDDGTALIGDVAGAEVISTDYRRTFISDRSGNVIDRIPTRFWGTFSPDASFVAAGGFLGRVRVWDRAGDAPLELRGLGDWKPALGFRWTPDGDLVVSALRTSEPDDDVDPVRRYVCRMPSGRCERLPGVSKVFYEPLLPSSALGQLIPLYGSD